MAFCMKLEVETVAEMGAKLTMAADYLAEAISTFEVATGMPFRSIDRKSVV